MKKAKQMEQTSIPKLLFKFSMPAVIALLVNALYNIVDGIFVGKGVGDSAFAGVTVTIPLITIFIAFIMLIAMGGTSLISIYLGENKKEEAEKILGNGLVMIVIIGVILTTIGLIFIEPLLKLFGAEGEVLKLAVDYMRIILIGSTFLAIGTGLNSFIRAEGNPKIAMVTMLIGAVVNIGLDALFIFGFKWGIKGAAFATVISYVVTTVWTMSYFKTKKSLLKLKLRHFKLDFKLIIEMAKLGFPTFIIQGMTSIQQLILNRALFSFEGKNGIVAIGVIINVTSLLTLPALGIGQGAQPIMGYNKGAGRNDRVRQTLILSMVLAVTTIFMGSFVVNLWPGQIFNMFVDSKETMDIGVAGMRIYFMFIPLVGIQMLGASYFQSTGKATTAGILALTRQVLIFIPLLLILPNFWGLKGIWWAAPLADIGAFLLTGVWLIIELRQASKKEELKLKESTS